jgi:uncharacterized protein
MTSRFFVLALFINGFYVMNTNAQSSPFKVIAFYNGNIEEAHSTFVNEANRWFHQKSIEHNFTYDSTDHWENLNAEFLSNYQVILFLDSRPEYPEQRDAFQKYMEDGGAWMGFHFAGFALTPSDFNQDWDWYHQQFLGAGSYVGNTWQPTSAILRVENSKHPATKKLPELFESAPNEWYKWEDNLRQNQDIDILISIDSSSFPLGTGPKQHEIWHSGYYPVVWTNRYFRMIYFNMGHNWIDFENATDRRRSSTFESNIQNQLFLDALLWLGEK